MMQIAVDAMGGDGAPEVVVDGAIMAARNSWASICLVGDEDVVQREITRKGGKNLPIRVLHAPEAISMAESAGSALRKGGHSSIGVGLDLVRRGEASAFVSAGNSGAVMSLAMHILGILPGVDRPAIATVLPARSGNVVMIDSGANVECQPRHLVQFAVMGDIYARLVLGHRRPRVGLLSNGEEEEKGTGLTRAASRLLKGLDHLNYVGYVEGRGIVGGDFDVIVVDGFTGNVTLKAMEGLGLMFEGLLRDAFGSNLKARLGYLLVRPALRRAIIRLDYAEYGGAPLLGLGGVVVVAHGGSSAKAVMNAIRVAHESVQRDVNGRIVEEIVSIAQLDSGEGGPKKRRLWNHLLGRFVRHRGPVVGSDG
jgi:glycerol-3-phosphate acyltransferase PlsX